MAFFFELPVGENRWTDPVFTVRNRFFRMIFVFLFLLDFVRVEARWFPFPPPAPEAQTALATLILGDDTWVGYANYGLVLFDYYGQAKLRLTPKEGLPGPTVTDLVQREKELWIGTSDGLAIRSETGGLKTFTAKDGLPDNGITCLTVRDSDVYAGTMKGLARFKGESFDLITDEKGLPSNHITALAPYPNGVIIGTTKGWATLEGNAVTPHTQATDGLPFEWITSVAYFNYRKSVIEKESNYSNDWFVLGTAGGGLIFYHDKTYNSFRKNDDGPGSDWINCLTYEPINNKLWVGTQDGMASEQIETGEWRRFSAETGGLISNQVKDISLRVIDESVKDYEILLGKGKCPFEGGPCGDLFPVSGTASATISTGTASGSGTVSTAVFSCTAEITKPGKGGPHQCPFCYAIPPVKKPRILHIFQTWAAIGTAEGATLYYEKVLPHFGQGNIFSYLSNKGWEVKGLGVGGLVFAGVWPPGAREGFLFYFDPPQIRFSCGYANPPETAFSSVINTLNTTVDGNPIAGGYSLGRGGIGILDLAADQSSLVNPWKIYGSKEGLTDLNVTCIFREGPTLLIGTGLLGKSGSIFRFRDGKFEPFPKTGLTRATNASMFGAVVTCLWGDEKVAYVGTKGEGVFYFDGNSWTRYESFGTKILSDDNIQCLTYRDNLLYVGTKKGIDVISPYIMAHVNITEIGAFTNNVQCLLWDDSEGDDQKLILWVGHQDGFSRFCRPFNTIDYCCSVSKNSCSHLQGRGTMPWPGNPPSAVLVYGDAWAGNPNGGQGNDGQRDVCPFDGMPGNKVTSMAYDDINLWIGTDNGICRYRK